MDVNIFEQKFDLIAELTLMYEELDLIKDTEKPEEFLIQYLEYERKKMKNRLKTLLIATKGGENSKVNEIRQEFKEIRRILSK